MFNKKDSVRAPHLDKTDFQIPRNPCNRPSFHHKKYRLMLHPVIPLRECIKIQKYIAQAGML